MRKRLAICLAAVVVASVGAAHAYEFWGVTVGTESYNGSSQLTFDGLAQSNVQHTVGGYEYTRVDSQWLGPFPAADPGAGYLISRKCDAQGLFFKADAQAAHFMIVTGSLQTGVTAPECGCGTRRYGPGDLKIDVNGLTYGVGLRLSDLTWAVDPATTNPEFRIISATGGYDNIYARDAGTLGKVELNPRWARVGHSALASGSDKAYAFYVSGSGTLAGEASVGFHSTGLALGVAPVYAYEVSVPWSAIGMGSAPQSFTASYRPDCGNDILSAQFDPSLDLASTPEPSTWIGLVSGLTALGVRKAKK
jgi:hypothetical protein